MQSESGQGNQQKAVTMFGRIPFPDRLQRLFLATCLMALTVLGLLSFVLKDVWLANWEGEAPAEPRRSAEIRLGGSLALPKKGLLKQSQESTDWKKWTALVLQTELFLTGLAGWCPIYWACRVGHLTSSQSNED